MATPPITQESLIAAIDAVWNVYKEVVSQLGPALDSGAPAVGEWNPRQVLSHVIGAWQRVPVHAGYFLAGIKDIPILYSDPYWQSEWLIAPLESFMAAMQTAVEGNKAFIRSLTPEQLGRCLPMGGDDVPLAAFLMGNYQRHIEALHVRQLKAFLAPA
jgi:hypothetical protein